MKKRAILYTENMENLLSLAEFLVSDNWEIVSWIQEHSRDCGKIPS